MSKTLKTVGTIVAVVGLVATGIGAAVGAGIIGGIAAGGTVATFAGVSAATFASIGAIASVAGTLISFAGTLTAKPGGTTGGSATQIKLDPSAGIPYMIGRTFNGGNVVHRDTYGTDNRYQSFVNAYSGAGPIDGIESFEVDREETTFSGGGAAVGTFNGYMWLDTQLGATPEGSALTAPYSGFPDWGSAHKLSGYAAALWTLKYDTKGKKYTGGVPASGIVGRGVKAYDPRLDSTYPGGSGPCRPLDETTYVYSENPWIHALTWALGRVQNSIRVLGIGAALAMINVASYVEAANVADANGWKAGGVVYSIDAKWDVLKMMAQAGGGEPVPNGAMISAMVSAPKTPLGTVTSADIAQEGEISVPGTQSRRSRINGVVPRYRSEDHGWEIVPGDAVRVASYVIADGGRRTKEVEYSLVQDVTQASQLAAYEVFNARELGPIELPLKPYFIGFKIGDCLLLNIPEFGLEDQEAIVTGRSINPATGVVSMTFRGETPEKHAVALALVGNAPPTPSLTTSDPSIVAAPDVADWTATGATFTDNGVSIPAIVASGEVGNVNADAVVFDFRPYDVGNGPEDNWAGASVEPPETIRKEITGVTPGTQYEIGVRYRVRGITGDRLILDPVTAGEWGGEENVSLLIRSAFILADTDLLIGADVSGDGQITVAAHEWDYPGRDDNVPRAGGLITGLTLGARYYVYFDDGTLEDTGPTYFATTSVYEATNTAENPYRHYIDMIDIPAAGDPPSTGGGGGGYGGGGCPTDDMYLVVKDVGPVQVADIEPETTIWARHQTTGIWGWYQVASIEFFEDEALEATIKGEVYRTSPSHLWWMDGAWRAMGTLAEAHSIGTRRMAAIQVEEAHTYRLLPTATGLVGMLSHNKVVDPDL